MAADITFEEMLAEYERLAARDGPKTGLTAPEIMAMTRWSKHKVNNFINDAIAQGKMVCEHHPRRGRDGVSRLRAVYVVVKKRGANGKRR